jgi:hypothetical protein
MRYAAAVPEIHVQNYRATGLSLLGSALAVGEPRPNDIHPTGAVYLVATARSLYLPLDVAA